MEILAVLDVKNLNNHVYTRESFQEFKKDYSIIVPLKQELEAVTRDNMVGTASNLQFMENCLVADISLYADVIPTEIQELIDSTDEFVFTMNCVAELDVETNTITNADIKYLSLVNKETSAYKDLYALAHPDVRKATGK